MKKIKLTKGKYAIVDDEDYPYISRFNWGLSGDGKFAVRMFIFRTKRTTLYMHSILIMNKPGSLIMHRNKNTVDNRKENLVVVPLQHIIHHRNPKDGSRKTSKYRGVCWDKVNKKWRSVIKKDKQITLGRYETEEEAALEYNKKAKELYGEFAYQNKI